MMSPDVVRSCSHRFIFDPEASEIVCERGCGWAVRVYDEKALAHAPGGQKLSSPSVRDNNLGSDQNAVIRDLRRPRRGVKVKDPVTWKDPTTGVTVEKTETTTLHYLSGALRFFPRSSNRDEDLIEELSNRLHGRVSDSDLAAIAAIYRKVLRKLEREKRQKALQALDQITGEPSR